MYWWVQKIKKRIDDVKLEKPIDITWAIKSWDWTVHKVSKYLERFDKNLDELMSKDLEELKKLYKSRWWNPNNFLKDKQALIYLISRKQVIDEQQKESGTI